MPDVAKLRKYVEWVEEQDRRPASESEWFQGWWRVAMKGNARVLDMFISRDDCRTAYCLAGKIAIDDGWQFTDSESEYVEKDGIVEPVQEAAAQSLGLHVRTAVHLFYGNNDAVDIRSIAERIVGERL